MRIGSQREPSRHGGVPASATFASSAPLASSAIVLASSAIAFASSAEPASWIVVASRLSTFRGEADVRTWLYAITRNVVRHRRRKAHRAHRRSVELALVPEPVSDAPNPEQSLASRQALRSVCSAIAELDEKYR